MDFETLHATLLKQARLRSTDVRKLPLAAGVYVFWLDAPEAICLKVGVAGPRRKDGLRGRIKLHLRSDPGNTVFATHMIADATPSWARGYDFRERADRIAFLRDKCYFQALAVPGVEKPDLERLERLLEDVLRPRYRGTVGGPYDVGTSVT